MVKFITTNKSIYEASNPTISYNFNTIKDKNYNYSISCWVFIDNYAAIKVVKLISLL